MDKITFMAQQMTALDIPYEFMEWTQRVVYPYTVGEYSEIVTVFKFELFQIMR